MKTQRTNGAKLTKENLLDVIMDGYKVLSKDANSNKSLKDRVVYTWKDYEKDPRKVPKDILSQLAEDITVAVEKLTSKLAPAPAPVEASSKPKLSVVKGNKKAVQEKTEEVKEDLEDEEEEDLEEEVEETPKTTKNSKTTTKKTTLKKETKKEAKVETTSDLTAGQLPLATIFPETLESEDFGTLTACPDKYSSMDEVADAINDGKTLIFATYWTKRHIKEFEYARAYEVPAPTKKGFPNDLDLMQVIYVCSGVEKLYSISSYTEAMLCFIGEDLARIECEAPDGTKFTMRYSNGLEFEIYEAEEVEEEE